MDFYHLRENVKKILDIGLDAVKTAFKKVVLKAGEFTGNEIGFAVTKSNDAKIDKKEPVEEIIIPLEKREEILNKLIKVLPNVTL